MIGLGLPVLVWRRALHRQNRPGEGREIPGNFYFWRFFKGLESRISEDPRTPKTGRTWTKWCFRLKIVAPAYGFDDGNVGDSMFSGLGQFLRFPAVLIGRPGTSSVGTSEPGCPSESNFSDVSVDVGQVVVASGDKPVYTCNWRRLRWLKRRPFASASASLGPPSICCASQGVGCGYADAGVAADRAFKACRCGGFLAPCGPRRGVQFLARW